MSSNFLTKDAGSQERQIFLRVQDVGVKECLFEVMLCFRTFTYAIRIQ